MQEGRICPSFCEKIHKICIFFVKYLVNFGLSPLHLATRQYLRTPPCKRLIPFDNTFGGRVYPIRHYPIALRLRTR